MTCFSSIYGQIKFPNMLLFTLVLAVLFTWQASAQITYQRSDWNKAVGEDSEYYLVSDPNSLALPTEGPNQVGTIAA